MDNERSESGAEGGRDLSTDEHLNVSQTHTRVKEGAPSKERGPRLKQTERRDGILIKVLLEKGNNPPDSSHVCHLSAA